MRRSAEGFTLVEMLIAGSLLVVLLTLISSLFVSTSRAYETNRAVTDASGQLRSAINALQYDLSMAGFTGVDAKAIDRSSDDALSIKFADKPSKGETGRPVESIRSTYVETRFTGTGGPKQQVVTFQLKGSDLERSVDSNPFTAIAADVRGLQLLSYRRSSGSKLGPDNPMPPDLTGLDLRVIYGQAGHELHEDFSVALLNQP